MKRLAWIARMLATASMCLMPGAVCLPLATTGCGCKCDWEGGQYFRLVAATREDTRVYLDFDVTGQPCCAGEWEEEVIVRIDLSGYTSGPVVGTRVDDMEGTALPVGPDERFELEDLGWLIEPTSNLFSVSDSVARPQQVVSLATGELAGKIKVPAGPAIH